MATVPDEVLGFYDLPQDEKNTWMARYGASAPFFWAAQSGSLQAPPEAQGFFGLPEGDQGHWYGEYGTAAPVEWLNQSSAAGGPAPPAAGAPPAPGAPAPLTRNARPTGWSPMTPSGLTGFTDFGRKALNILPEYVPHLNDPKLAPGYLPSSGTYNQYRLDQPGLFGTLPGTTGTVNLRYGLGGTGDPTTGGEVQTPQRWVTGSPTASTQAMAGDERWRSSGGMWRGGGGGGGGGGAPQGGDWQPVDGYAGVDVWRAAGGGGGGTGGGYFSAGPSAGTANWGSPQSPQTQGLDYLITNFMRSDTPTGIGTAAWSAPPQMWQGLIDAIRSGLVVVNSPEAWQMLAEKVPGTTPQSVGGAALTGAQPGAGGPGVGDDTGLTNYYAQMAAVQQANQAMQAAFSEWTMNTGDEKLAMQKAQEAWSRTFQEAQQKFSQGVSEAGLLGTYNGQQTQAAQQQQWSQGFQERGQQQSGALSLLQLQSQLQGPQDWLKYQQLNASTPQGLQSALGALAGNYTLAGSNAQGTPGPASLTSRIGDLTSNAQGQAAPAAPGSAELTSPNQFALRNWATMSPSQQKMVTGLYGGAGYDQEDFLKQIQNAAPRYSGPSAGTVRM